MSEAKRSRSATSGRQKSGGARGAKPPVSVPNLINKSRRQAFFLFFLSFLRVVGGGVFLAGGLKGGSGGISPQGTTRAGIQASFFFLFFPFFLPFKKSLLCFKACFVISFFSLFSFLFACRPFCGTVALDKH